MTKTICVATVQIAVEIDDESAAADFIWDLLGGSAIDQLYDWGYADIGGRLLHPTALFVKDNWNIRDTYVTQRSA